MPTVEQLQKIALRTTSEAAAKKFLFNHNNAFNMKELTYSAMVQGANEYISRDSVYPIVSSLVGSNMNAEHVNMLSDLVGLMFSDYGLRLVLENKDEGEKEKSFLNTVVKYAVSYNLGDMLNDMMGTQLKTTTSS